MNPQPKKSSSHAKANETSHTSVGPKNSPGASNNNGNPGEAKLKDVKGDCHKEAFQTSFKTITLTLGSLGGCLRRATDLSDSEVSVVVERVNQAVHVLSIARCLVFRALEYFVYKSLDKIVKENAPPKGKKNAKKSRVKGANKQDDKGMDPLDILLNGKHGETLVRNLIACFLNGSVSKRGAQPTGTALQVRRLATDIYDDMKRLLPDLNRLNTTNMPLSIPQGDMAANIHSAIRLHFGRLPMLIIGKVRLL